MNRHSTFACYNFSTFACYATESLKRLAFFAFAKYNGIILSRLSVAFVCGPMPKAEAEGLAIKEFQ